MPDQLQADYQAALAAASNEKPKPRKKANVRWTQGGKLLLDEHLIETLRGEFLTLMKAAERAPDYQDALKVKEAVRRWKDKFDELIYEDLIKHDLWEIIGNSRHVSRDDKGIILSIHREKLNDWVTYWKKKIAPGCWNLHMDLSVPLERVELRQKAWEGTSHVVTETGQYQQFLRDRKKWLDRVKRGAVAAWKILLEFIRWAEPPVPVLQRVDPVRTVIDGFQIVVSGHGKGWTPEDAFGPIASALRRFRVRADKVLPWVVRHMLPMELRFLCDLDEGGQYHTRNDGNYISVCVAGRRPDEYAHIIAHEMGHHVWKTYLHQESRKFWQEAIAADRGVLDLRKVLACWRKSGTRNVGDFLDWLKDNAPVTFLKLDALVMSHYLDGSFQKVSDVGDFEELERQGKVVHVPRNPITVYANKNSEEAFCEAFGYLVAYGPQALLPDVRGWLAVAVPGIKIA